MSFRRKAYARVDVTRVVSGLYLLRRRWHAWPDSSTRDTSRPGHAQTIFVSRHDDRQASGPKTPQGQTHIDMSSKSFRLDSYHFHGFTRNNLNTLGFSMNFNLLCLISVHQFIAFCIHNFPRFYNCKIMNFQVKKKLKKKTNCLRHKKLHDCL